MTDDGGCNPPTPAEREAKLRNQIRRLEAMRSAADEMRLQIVVVAEHNPYELLGPDEAPCSICKAVADYDAARKDLP